MGASSSTPQVQAPVFDFAKAKVELPDFEDYQETVEKTTADANARIAQLSQKASQYSGILKVLGIIAVLGLIGSLSYYYLWPMIQGWIGSLKYGGKDTGGSGKDLSITSASVGSTDVKQKVIDRVSKNELHIQVDDTVGATEGTSLVVTYQYPGESPGSITVPYGKPMDIEPAVKDPEATKSGTSSWWDNRNLMATAKDAKVVSTVSVADNSTEGDYGYQFWMYVSDWNYRYGEEKMVMYRSDSTNTQIKNPMISLHPTDNKLKISVSIFPTTDGSSKTEPAPAGHSGATDDVYICEIGSIPLQTWFAVSVSLSTRNLDVYINGQLVKSCFLTGVPKPVSGSVTLNSDGGFAGYMCSFYHYAKLLIPSDTQSFFSSGVPCSVPNTNSNYKVAIGLRDTKGTVVSNYMF
jgi:hypothetical protein